MWMLPTNKSLLYALGIRPDIGQRIRCGLHPRRRIYRGEITLTAAALIPSRRWPPNINLQRQRWPKSVPSDRNGTTSHKGQSVKLAETTRQLDTKPYASNRR